MSLHCWLVCNNHSITRPAALKRSCKIPSFICMIDCVHVAPFTENRALCLEHLVCPFKTRCRRSVLGFGVLQFTGGHSLQSDFRLTLHCNSVHSKVDHEPAYAKATVSRWCVVYFLLLSEDKTPCKVTLQQQQRHPSVCCRPLLPTAATVLGGGLATLCVTSSLIRIFTLPISGSSDSYC